MAEALGVVASGIAVAQLAGQVTKSIVKLKDYWDQVRDAPAEIKYLLKEIDSLSLILQHIQGVQVGLSSDSACVQQCFDLCQEAATELGELVKAMSEKIEGNRGWKKRVGSAKVVLKKEEIKKLKKRMKNAVSLLSLALQWRTNALIQSQPDIIIGRMTKTLALLPSSQSMVASNVTSQGIGLEDPLNPAFKDVWSKYQQQSLSQLPLQSILGAIYFESRIVKRRDKNFRTIRARFQILPWLINRNWDFHAFEKSTAWQFTFQAYRVVPSSSPLFSYARSGNVEGIRELLATRQAFVTDRDEWENSTALHIAAGEGQTEVCKSLLSEGADPLARDISDRTPLHTLATYSGLLAFIKGLVPLDLARVLVKSGATELLIDDIEILKQFRGPKVVFQYLQKELYPPYDEFPLQERSLIAIELLQSSWDNMPDMIRYSLGKEFTNSIVLSWGNDRGQSLLHQLNLNHLECTWRLYGVYTSKISEQKSRLKKLGGKSLVWRELIREYISAGAALHTVDKRGCTPLLYMITTYEKCYLWGDSNINWLHRRRSDFIQQWLADLEACGVDLLLYGKTEKTLFDKYYRYNFEYLDSDRGRQWSPKSDWNPGLIDFSYGPHPENWQFWFPELSDGFLGEFWAMVETEDLMTPDPSTFQMGPHPPMPGSWIEQPDD